MHPKISSGVWRPFCPEAEGDELSLVVRQTKHSMQTCSVPWLLMPWHQVLLGHQQPCYLQCKIKVIFVILSQCFKTINLKICDVSVSRNDMKCKLHFDGLMQERCNSIANALELCVSCINPAICTFSKQFWHINGWDLKNWLVNHSALYVFLYSYGAIHSAGGFIHTLTHLSLVPHICVSELGHHWFR